MEYKCTVHRICRQSGHTKSKIIYNKRSFQSKTHVGHLQIHWCKDIEKNKDINTQTK